MAGNPRFASMLNRLILVSCLFLVAACGQKPEPRIAPAPAMLLKTRLLGDPPTAVEILVENEVPSRRIERIQLIDPQGVSYEAESLHRTPRQSAVTQTRPPLSVYIQGGTQTRLQPSVTVPGPPPETQTQQAVRDVRAVIPLPDLAGYLATLEDWRVVILSRDLTGEPLTYDAPAPRL